MTLLILGYVALMAADAINGMTKRGSDGGVIRSVDGGTNGAICSDRVQRVRLPGFDTAAIFLPGCLSETIPGYRGLFALRIGLFRAGEIKPQ